MRAFRKAVSVVVCAGAILGIAIAQASAARETREVVDYQSDYEKGTIVIDTSERHLYYVLGDGKALRYSVAVGTPQNQWFGETHVARKRENPSWTPTPDMRARNPNLPNYVPPGPKNPLGVRAIYLGWSAYRIHGTTAPWSIGRAASNGCIRMLNEDVTDLYERVHVGAPVIVTH
ncbi:MAG: L,D-transpeptidase [Hyphomicrobiales bacterium]|nr:L,D-transpeptidase [Hyphomicrobiales bacterium]